VIEALFDSRGVKAVAPKASGIFSAQPPSQDPGVGVTIVAEPGSMSQEKVSSLTDEQLRALGKGDQDIIKQTIEPLQLRLVSFSQIRRQVVGGKTALTYELRTSDSNSQQRVVNNMIFNLGDRKFTVTTSRPLSDTDLLGLIFEKIISSLQFD